MFEARTRLHLPTLELLVAFLAAGLAANIFGRIGCVAFLLPAGILISGAQRAAETWLRRLMVVLAGGTVALALQALARDRLDTLVLLGFTVAAGVAACALTFLSTRTRGER